MSIASSKPYVNIPWNVYLGVFVGLASLFFSQIIAVFLVALIASLNGLHSSAATDWLNNSTLAQFLFVLFSEIISVTAILFFLKYYNKGYKLIGLVKPKLIDPLYGLIAFPLYYSTLIVSVLIIKVFDKHLNVSQKQELGFNNVHGEINLILTFISLVLLPPIAEEIIFRGLIYTSFRKKFSIIIAALITSTLFALGHLLESGSGGLLYIAGIDTFILSLFLIALREKTGRLYASMTLHGLKNFVAFIAIFVLNIS